MTAPATWTPAEARAWELRWRRALAAHEEEGRLRAERECREVEAENHYVDGEPCWEIEQ